MVHPEDMDFAPAALLDDPGWAEDFEAGWARLVQPPQPLVRTPEGTGTRKRWRWLRR